MYIVLLMSFFEAKKSSFRDIVNRYNFSYNPSVQTFQFNASTLETPLYNFVYVSLILALKHEKRKQ